MIATRRHMLALLAGTFLPTACLTGPPPLPPPADAAAAAAKALADAAAAPTAIDLTIIGEPDQNGGGLPMQVELFLLKATPAFERLGYFQLMEGGGPLAADAAARRSLSVAPGTTQSQRIEVPAGVTHLGAVGQFRAIEQAAWRAIRPVPRGTTTKMTLRLRAAALVLEPTRG